MTDKQIMIDGVDVSGCKFFEDGECLNPSETVANCEASPNCYFKQLKRKEQECERLEKQNDILLGQLVINDGEDVTVQISQSQFEEYNQLKAENETYKKMLEDEEVILALNEVRTGERHLWYNKAQRLEQALTEIKEIAEHCMKQDICTTCDNSDKCNIEDEEIPTYDVCKLILQKCEVLNDQVS